MIGNKPYHYQAGGSLPIHAPSYVIREADTLLFQAVTAGEYCYILDARQMGKSSLRARTMNRLNRNGVISTEVELSGIGSQQTTAHQWYGGIIWELMSGLSLDINRRQWLKTHDHLSPVQRLGTFMDTVVLHQISQPLVIFFDEIDSVLGLDFPTDDFFALIRHWYDKRATDDRYQRLAIALLGVASPQALIQNSPQATPFNIGHSIQLRGFQLHEVGALMAGFRPDCRDPEGLLREILAWTGGQPFLTQKVCRLVRQTLDKLEDPIPLGGRSPDQLKALVSTVIQEQIIHRWQEQDEPEHLRTIRDRLLYSPHSSRELLLLYQQILHSAPSHNRPLPMHDRQRIRLQLSGLVVHQSGQFVVKNRIYQTIFDQQWIEHALRYFPAPAAGRDLPERRMPEVGWAKDVRRCPSPSLSDGRALALPTLRRIGLPPPSRTQQSSGKGQWMSRGRAVAIGTISAALVVGLRMIGLWQSWELQSFDQLMRLRPPESADPRLLLIHITEADVQAQPVTERGSASLADSTLEQLRLKLDQGQPRTIGFDLYREQSVAPQYASLAQWMRSRPHFFAICNYGTPGIPAPPEIPLPRQGFNNVLVDKDGILRRYPIAVADADPCESAYALSWVLAAHYLAADGIEAHINANQVLQLGQTSFPPLTPSIGGYQYLNARGHQLMINYRATSTVAETITLGEFLSDRTSAQRVRDRIVLIGTSAPSFNDHNWYTPLTPPQGNGRSLTGIEVQAHLVSQLLSATLDQRPLIWSWHEGGESLWIWGWTVAGSVLTVGARSCWRRIGIIVGLGAGVYGISWGVLLIGGWLCLVPTMIALLLGAGTTHLMVQAMEEKE